MAVTPTGDMKSGFLTASHVHKPGDPVPAKAHAPTVLTASSASDPLAGRPDLTGPLTFSDRVRALSQKYEISVQRIVLPLITGLGLVLFGKVAAAVLAGKVLLAVAALACAHQIYHIRKVYLSFYDPKNGVLAASVKDQTTGINQPRSTEIHEAIAAANEKSVEAPESNHAWVKYAIATHKQELQIVSVNARKTPLDYALSLKDAISVAMIQRVSPNPIATAAAAAASAKK